VEPSLGAPPRRLVEVVMFGRKLVTPHQAALLEERARFMRFNPTRGEERLWRELSGSKTGFASRRQLVIGNHIVDFACPKVRLALEVDGGSHTHKQQHDAHRDRTLATLGWSVLHFDEDRLFANIADVVTTIRNAARRAP